MSDIYKIKPAGVNILGSEAGWSLVAKIKYLEGEKLVFCIPGEFCPEIQR